MNENYYKLKEQDKPVAYLEHEPAKTNISVYKHICWFQRVMIRICFGLKYKKV